MFSKVLFFDGDDYDDQDDVIATSFRRAALTIHYRIRKVFFANRNKSQIFFEVLLKY